MRWYRHRSCRKEVDVAGGVVGAQEEDMLKLEGLQHHRWNPQSTRLRLPQIEEEAEADERGAGDRDLAHGWLLVGANSVDS
jgi:hypothetical protein